MASPSRLSLRVLTGTDAYPFDPKDVSRVPLVLYRYIAPDIESTTSFAPTVLRGW
jgi:hypothetical protein